MLHLLGRTPHGVRGLKFGDETDAHLVDESHPSRGAWIEILLRSIGRTSSGQSHPSRGAWIEIGVTAWDGRSRLSHPSRGAWIEIYAGRCP